MLQEMQGISFNWSRWRAGSLLDLGIVIRYKNIIENQSIIKRYAIGWCRGESVLCRSKQDCIAVMFRKDGVVFWNHLLKKEFDEIFGGIIDEY